MQAALQGGSARAARVAHGVAVVAVRVHFQDDGPVVHGVALGVRHALRMAGRVSSTILTCCSPLVKLECAFLGSSTGAPTFWMLDKLQYSTRSLARATWQDSVNAAQIQVRPTQTEGARA